MGSPSQVNVEYLFRLIYDCFHGGCVLSGSYAGFSALLAHWWVWITIIGYLLSALGLGIIVWATMRLFALRHEEHKELGPLHIAKEEGPLNPRWQHIEQMMESDNPNDWRQAIIEADIMLDDMLTKQGYHGAGVGEKLKAVEPADFDSLQDAWQAHLVRNDIAHQGASFNISKQFAQRTIGLYEKVFREFGGI